MSADERALRLFLNSAIAFKPCPSPLPLIVIGQMGSSASHPGCSYDCHTQGVIVEFRLKSIVACISRIVDAGGPSDVISDMFILVHQMLRDHPLDRTPRDVYELDWAYKRYQMSFNVLAIRARVVED